MIPRPHVCLRCQIRKAKRPIASRPKHLGIGIQPSQVAFQSTAARLAPGDPEQDVNQDHGHDDSNANGNTVAPSDALSANLSLDPPPQFEYPRIRPPIRRPRNVPLSEYPMGKLYGFGGKMRRQTKHNLEGKEVLGQPARVLLLKDSPYVKQEKIANREIEAEKARSIDIMATLDSERGIVGQAEVNSNIHGLRPAKGQDPVDWLGFDALVQELSSGFTGSQLASYIQTFSKAPQSMVAVEKVSKDMSNVNMRITPWRAGISNSSERLSSDAGVDNLFASYTAKQLLALRLMSACWRLDPPDADEGIGELEIQLQPGDFELVMKGSNSAVASLVARHNTKIQAFQKQHVLRITNTREMSNLIVEELKGILAKVKRVKIHMEDLIPPVLPKGWERLRQWALANFGPAFMTELSLLTKTVIEIGRRQKVTISCIDDSGSVTSNRADVARRLIVTSGIFSSRVTYWLGYRDIPHESQGVFVPYPVTEGMTWRERLLHWSRWSTPVAKSEPEDMTQKAIEAPESKSSEVALPPRKALRLLGSISKPEKSREWPKASGYTYWTPIPWVNNSCIFGTILHSHSPGAAPKSVTDLLDKNEDTSMKIQQTFSTKIPNISKVLSGLSAENPNISLRDGLPIESLVLKFLPNPFFYDKKTQKVIGSSALSTYPAMEMHFSVGPENKELILKDIQAVVNVDNADLMLPDASVDMRFQQKSTSRLRVLHRKEYPASIRKFLDNMSSSLSFANGSLKTPSKCTFPIARHLFEGNGNPKKLYDAHEMQDVEYLYAGLEQRRRLTMDYEGWVIHYTFIECGRAGGRRGELRLRPVRTNRDEADKPDEKAFIKAAFRIAEALDEGWVVRKVKEKLVRGEPSSRQFYAKKVDIFYTGYEGEDAVQVEEVAEEQQDSENEETVAKGDNVKGNDV